MKTAEQDVPVLRFKDEQGKDYPDWEFKKLGQVAKRIIKKNIDNTISKVLTNSATKGILNQGEYFDNDVANVNNLSGYYTVKMGDYVYNPRISANAPFGPINKNQLVDGVMSPLYTVFRFNYDKNDFYKYLFKSNVWHRYIYSVANYGARHDRMSITTNDFIKMPLPVPCREEQQKIAAFLSSVDTKIEQLNRKKALLEQYKKGMMQKLFSQEIRFKDEQGKDYPDWEEKRLSEILTIRYGKDHKSLHNGHVPVLGTGGVIRYVDSVIYNQPSVLIGRKGTIDKPQYIEQPFWTVDTLFYTEIIPPNIPFFIFLVVSNINFKRYNEATGVPSLNANTVIKIRVYVPSKEEQQKIAAFMSAIDRKIELVSEQLKQAQIFKKGLLQQMFI